MDGCRGGTKVGLLPPSLPTFHLFPPPPLLLKHTLPPTNFSSSHSNSKLCLDWLCVGLTQILSQFQFVTDNNSLCPHVAALVVELLFLAVQTDVAPCPAPILFHFHDLPTSLLSCLCSLTPCSLRWLQNLQISKVKPKLTPVPLATDCAQFLSEQRR